MYTMKKERAFFIFSCEEVELKTICKTESVVS